MADVESVRRYYLCKLNHERENDGEEGYWRTKQQAEPGTALPAGFPFLSTLAGCDYSTIEDLDGADSAELVRWVGLNSRQADNVIAALAPLL